MPKKDNAYTKNFKRKLKKKLPNYKLISEYVNNQTLVIVVNKLTGLEFKSTPVSLLKGIEPRIMAAIDKNKLFEITSREIHGVKYSYSQVNYINNATHVIITCPNHGNFSQKPEYHIYYKSGCPQCAYNSLGSAYYKNKLNWGNQAYCYLFKISDDVEEFFKVGVSLNLNKRRLDIERSTSYKVELQDSIFTTVYDAYYNLEQPKHKKMKRLNYQYIPEQSFGGMYECYKGEGLTIKSKLL